MIHVHHVHFWIIAKQQHNTKYVLKLFEQRKNLSVPLLRRVVGFQELYYKSVSYFYDRFIAWYEGRYSVQQNVCFLVIIDEPRRKRQTSHYCCGVFFLWILLAWSWVLVSLSPISTLAWSWILVSLSLYFYHTVFFFLTLSTTQLIFIFWF